MPFSPVTKDGKEVLLAYFDFPAEHWDHLRAILTLSDPERQLQRTPEPTAVIARR